ncbi:hypothetical protein [Nocardia sp. NPDC048505]
MRHITPLLRRVLLLRIATRLRAVLRLLRELTRLRGVLLPLLRRLRL